jgi:hypothetical protein
VTHSLWIASFNELTWHCRTAKHSKQETMQKPCRNHLIFRHWIQKSLNIIKLHYQRDAEVVGTQLFQKFVTSLPARLPWICRYTGAADLNSEKKLSVSTWVLFQHQQATDIKINLNMYLLYDILIWYIQSRVFIWDIISIISWHIMCGKTHFIDSAASQKEHDGLGHLSLSDVSRRAEMQSESVTGYNMVTMANIVGWLWLVMVTIKWWVHIGWWLMADELWLSYGWWLVDNGPLLVDGWWLADA